MRGTRGPIERMKRANTMIRKVRSDAVEWTLAFDSMLNGIISTYFARDDEDRRSLLEYEILPMLTASQRIQALSNLKTGTGTSFASRYPRLIRQLYLLNSYRNLLVHGFPSTIDKPQLWIWRRKMKPVPMNARIASKLENTANVAFDALGNLYKKMINQAHLKKIEKKLDCNFLTLAR